MKISIIVKAGRSLWVDLMRDDGQATLSLSYGGGGERVNMNNAAIGRGVIARALFRGGPLHGGIEPVNWDDADRFFKGHLALMFNFGSK